MPNSTFTSLDTGSVILDDARHADELLTFTGAGTVLAGTILARSTSTLKLVPFVKGGVANGNGIPSAIVAVPVVATGAGDEAIRAMIAGVVRDERLIIDADGNNSNVDGTVRDQLRSSAIIPLSVQELGGLDNV